MTSIVKRLSIVVIIIAAAILVYGFIDAGSYREGYKAGYDRVSRAVDAACVNGLISDNGLCAVAASALYADDINNTLQLAQVADSLGASKPVASTDASMPLAPVKKLSKAAQRKAAQAAKAAALKKAIEEKTAVDATIPAVAPIELLPVATVVEPPPPPPPTEEEIKKTKALAADCSAAKKDSEACLRMDPYCVMSITKRDGSGRYVNADYTAGCTDSEVKVERMSFDPNDPCSQSDIQARMPRARMITGTSGEKICSDNVTFLYLREEKSLGGKLMPFGDKASLSELLRSPGLKAFAEKAGAKAVVAPVVAPASTPTPAPMYQIPGGYMPPYGGGYTPPHASVYKPLTFANLIDAFVGLFRRGE